MGMKARSKWAQHDRDLIKRSIDAWVLKRADPANHRPSVESCPLCEVYHQGRFLGVGDPDNYCKGCPIRKTTGVEGCAKTPYQTAMNIWNEMNQEDFDVIPKRWREACNKEIKFLKSLLNK